MPTGFLQWKQRLHIAMKKQYCYIADVCQMENSSVAQERGAGGGGQNSHSKVTTAFFPGRFFFFPRLQEESALFFSPSLPRLYKT